MNRSTIDDARKCWRAAVDELCTGYYADEKRAAQFFDTRIAPVWRAALHLEDRTAQQIRHDLDVTPTMCLMLHFWGVGVLRLFKAKPAPKLTGKVWPPFIKDGSMHEVHAIPKGDVARVIGKTPSAVERALRGFRGTSGRTGTQLYDAKLVYPAPFATGIMLDGSFEMQLSLPFLYKFFAYEQLGIFSKDQREGVGRTWTQAKTWAGDAKRALTGTPKLIVPPKETANDRDSKTGTDS